MPENTLSRIFTNNEIVNKVKDKLPKMFAIAELESSRAGKIGMEVGSVREQILVALLVSAFGEENVETEIPITRYEEDVRVLGKPISIKTITGSSGVKVIWTVDARKAQEFFDSYKPSCDMLLAVISWNNNQKTKTGLFFIPRFIQEKTLKKLGEGLK